MAAEIEEVLASVWPDWKIIEPIGYGAYATVYKARRQDQVGTSEAAIKVTVVPNDPEVIDEMKQQGKSDDEIALYLQNIVRGYAKEIKLLDAVRGNTNIVHIDDYKVIRDNESGLWYIILRMELLLPLLKRMQLAPLNEEEILRMGIDLCTALTVCHRHNIVHRDIKPENIFVNKSGDYKLGDFGVARNLEEMTINLSRKGTPNYMAPELYHSLLKETDFETAARVDIYGLGLVMYYLANKGKMPFLPTNKQIASPADRKEALGRRIRGDQLPELTNISKPLERIIMKACAYQAQDRYPSAAAMLDDLEALRHGHIHQQDEEADLNEPVRHSHVRQSNEEADLDATVRHDHVHKSNEEADLDATVHVQADHEPRVQKQITTTPEKIIGLALIAIVLVLVALAIGLLVNAFTSKNNKSLSTTVPGFMNDPVKVTLSLDSQKRIKDIKVDASSQLNGVGLVCEHDDFTKQFIGKKGPFTAGENIDVCTGATFTSQAVIDAVNKLIP